MVTAILRSSWPYGRNATDAEQDLYQAPTSRVLATDNEAAHRVHSGNPAFRRPSIKRFHFEKAPRASHEEIVNVGSISSIRAAACRASASRSRWANADARQR